MIPKQSDRRGLVCRLLLATALATAPLGLGGCTIFGAAAAALPKAKEPPAYRDLKNHNVAVMVWADHGIRTDFPRVQLDTAGAIQNKLKADPEAEDLKGVTWPWEARSVYRYQQDHPEIEAMPIAEVAPRLPRVTRLIYVEIEMFSTRAEEAMQLWRGSATATVKIVEVLDGKGKIGYEEHNIRAVYPPKSPAEGVPGGDPYQFYLGTVDELATQIANRFMPHEGEE